VRYFLADTQGSTRLLSDATGAITSSYDYSAFGETLSTNAETAYLYTSQQYDAATAMYSLRARYYAPGAGRFVSRDVWPVDYGDPWELNRYGYVGNNPGNYSDPTGWEAGASIAVRAGFVLKASAIAIVGIAVIAVLVREIRHLYLLGQADEQGNGPQLPGPSSGSATPLPLPGASKLPSATLAAQKQAAKANKCTTWPTGNNKTLVERLCNLYYNGQPTPISLQNMWSNQQDVYNYFIQSKKYICSGVTLSVPQCRQRIADIMAWIWFNGGDVGQRAVEGFALGLVQHPFTEVKFAPGGTKAGNSGWFGGGILTFDSKYETSPIDFNLGLVFVHEMEHYYYDKNYTGTRLGEAFAYLAGYLFGIETGVTFDTTTIDPTYQFGLVYTGEEASHGSDLGTDASYARYFSRHYIESTLGPMAGGNSHPDESKLPLY
jgi:RHS repeat-associated protein